MLICVIVCSTVISATLRKSFVDDIFEKYSKFDQFLTHNSKWTDFAFFEIDLTTAILNLEVENYSCYHVDRQEDRNFIIFV